MNFSTWKNIKDISLPYNNLNWSNSHMSHPVPYFTNNKLFVFYGTRDKDNISSISWVELDFENDFKVINSPKKPILIKGKLGSFDDSGVIPSSIIKIKNKHYLYYMGWSKGGDVASQNAGGISQINFEKMQASKLFEGPILDRTQDEPLYCAVPRVQKINNKLFVYYLGVNYWIGQAPSKDAVYEIRIGTSSDGIKWDRKNIKALNLSSKEGGHYPFSIIKNGGKHYGFYSSRNKFDYRTNVKNTYKIFYAESEDGYKWEKKGKIKFLKPINSTEGNMQAYPSVLKVNNRILLFYNGNSFGRDGFKISELQQD
jgi:predicted GH43/DUF377 family glycosyl hydrolase